MTTKDHSLATVDRESHAKQAQHDAAVALFGAIIEALEKNRKEGTLTSTALDELARAYAAVATNVPELGHLE